MIDRGLLDRGHSALCVMRDTEAGTAVLRELLAAVEAEGLCSNFPVLRYVVGDESRNLAHPNGLDGLTRVGLRIALALVDHAQETLQLELITTDPSPAGTEST